MESSRQALLVSPPSGRPRAWAQAPPGEQPPPPIGALGHGPGMGPRRLRPRINWMGCAMVTGGLATGSAGLRRADSIDCTASTAPSCLFTRPAPRSPYHWACGSYSERNRSLAVGRPRTGKLLGHWLDRPVLQDWDVTPQIISDLIRNRAGPCATPARQAEAREARVETPQQLCGIHVCLHQLPRGSHHELIVKAHTATRDGKHLNRTLQVRKPSEKSH